MRAYLRGLSDLTRIQHVTRVARAYGKEACRLREKELHRRAEDARACIGLPGGNVSLCSRLLFLARRWNDRKKWII